MDNCPLCDKKIEIMPTPTGGPETYVILNNQFVHIKCLQAETRKKLKMSM